MITGVSLFTGGGLLDIGLRGIVDFVGGVEQDPQIAAHASIALGHEVMCDSVCDMDYQQWSGVDYIHASPPCTNASVANPRAGETDSDTALSGAVCRAIRHIGPRYFTLENVEGYAGFNSFQDILECLAALGYAVHWRVYDAANFGVPQHRKRIMLRAERDARALEAVPPTHGSFAKAELDRVQPKLFQSPVIPWRGWYSAVADLLAECPAAELAGWQERRLTEKYGAQWLDNVLVNGLPMNHRKDIDARGEERPAPPLTSSYTKHPFRAVLVEGQSKGNRPPCLTLDHLPSPTQAATGGGNVNRAILAQEEPEGRRIVALTTRCLARLQTVPDDYFLPEGRGLATKIIGNGVACGAARAIFGPMLAGGGK